MKKILLKLSEKYGDAKSRTVIIFIGFLLLVGVVIAVSNMQNEQSLDAAVGSANIARLGGQIESKPGIGDASEAYNQLRYEKNRQDADAAAQRGGSSVPTIVSDQVVGETSSADLIRQEQQRLARERENAYQQLLDQRRQEEVNLLQQQQSSQQHSELVARQQGFENLMSNQANSLFSQWAQVPRQVYTGSGITELPQPAGTDVAQVPGTSSRASSNIIYKAGDIVFAVLETSINSDEEGPIMARIVQGPLKGAKIIGSYEAAGLYAKKLKLVFNVMNVPRMDYSINFNAVAIDPELGRTALASHVNNHYLLRYGSLFGASFLEGMSDAIMASIGSSGGGGGGGVVISTTGAVDSKSLQTTERDLVLSGLGNIGKNIAQHTNLFDRPITITLEAGTSFGLLMLADLDVNVGRQKALPGQSLGPAGLQQLVDSQQSGAGSSPFAQPASAFMNSQSQIFSEAVQDATRIRSYNQINR